VKGPQIEKPRPSFSENVALCACSSLALVQKKGLAMSHEAVSPELMDLLNQALARELQVSVQYMLQHAVGAGRWAAISGKTPIAMQTKFIASHASVYLPGSSLKKIAITEMRHAEGIAERITLLGGEPTTQPAAITLDKGAKEMLENDVEQERGAIELYRQIIDVAGREHDSITRGLFQSILPDEEKHHRLFSELLARG
jgi:bacterioferritin